MSSLVYGEINDSAKVPEEKKLICHGDTKDLDMPQNELFCRWVDNLSLWVLVYRDIFMIMRP